MITVFTTMLKGMLRDMHTLFWTIAFPVLLLLGLGLYFQQPAYSVKLLSGILAMNVLFGATMVTAFNVMSHRNRGVYKLLRATPFSTFAFVAAMTAARTALSLIVSAVTIAAARLILGVSLSPLSLLLMLVVLLIGTVCFTAIGFIAANLSRDESNVNMISNLISFPMLFTSEAFYSLQHAPAWIQIFGSLQPFHYFVQAMNLALDPIGSLPGFGISMLILAVFTIICLGAAALTFRWDNEAPARRNPAATMSGGSPS
ncbi:ABC transporter permease [Paenibacillus woosongensis]|uniref:Transport permease protein n=1 Tax=Paenibacillus woosongensis TaxID=307580 RepID=A0A7X2Z4Y8_9BACL|nr:ABC transporter permease [Paenibacillus woosongensis]MUG46879.1 ABC transporter permease [Paenibacillus woosongensis]